MMSGLARKEGVERSGLRVWLLPRKVDGPLRPPNSHVRETGGLRDETAGAGVRRDVGQNGGGLSAEHALVLDGEERPSSEEDLQTELADRSVEPGQSTSPPNRSTASRFELPGPAS